MTDLFSLVPLRAGEIEVGKPISRPIYDWHGNLLLAADTVIASREQLDGLIGIGFVQDGHWDLDERKRSASAAPPISRETKFQAAEGKEPRAVKEAADKDVVMDLDDVKWAVGETFYMQCVDNQAIRYTVRLIGFVKGKSVLVTAPAIDGKFAFIRDGQSFVVRAFSGKRAFAFVANAIKSVHTPHAYLHLSYPKEMRCTVVRRGIRAQVKIIASVSLGTPERTTAATLTDLSTGGASGVLKEMIGGKGSEGIVKFRLHVADNDEYLAVNAIVRSAAPAESGDGFRYGIEFVDLTARDRLILSAFVHQALVEID